MAGPGHNSDLSKTTADQLRLFVERLERLEEEIKGINDDKKDTYSELKGQGFDPKIVKRVLAIRRKRKGEHEEEQMILETYLAALGML
ncbi:MAG: DUF2312 domain-containing protein [Rhizorhabdus sp.]|uniref:DUF2312 domain-containing protein n=1 Tax=Rhizorhabdus sp. TaxID=1968843 RepID=UPI001B6825FC|nr:DUF2312 domain-containing protein [Rhizorhabdus sp.]MBP8235264.1 DUF2312 domain-containing protein [Rhizorhabdus sp.]